MEKFKSILEYICFIIILLFAVKGFINFVSDKNTDKINKTIIDTNYNHIILDSIEYNIIKKDSIIYRINIIYEDSIAKSFHHNNDDAVKLFNKLVTEDW